MEFILPSARHFRQLGTTNSSKETPSRSTYSKSMNSSKLDVPHTYITIRVRSRFLSRPLKFIHEFLPLGITLRKRVLELIPVEHMAILAMYSLSIRQPTSDKEWDQRTNRVPCSSRMLFLILEVSQNGLIALTCNPSTFWVINRLNIEPCMPAAMAVWDVFGIASRTGGYPKYERSLIRTRVKS